MRARIYRASRERSLRLCLFYSLVQQPFALGVDIKSYGIRFLVDGSVPAQEPSVRLLVRMIDLFQRSEWELHVLAARERRDYFIENGIENLHRLAARQPPLTQLTDYIS